MQTIHGVTVPFDVPPQRVVSLVPSLTLSLFELDLGSRLVGVTDLCTEPAAEVARLPHVGAPHRPDVARVLALRPDLVLADDDTNREEDIAALEQAGVTVWTVMPRCVKDVTDLLWAIMYAFDHAAMVPRVRLIEQAVDYMRLAAESRSPLKVFVPLWRDPWMTFGPETYMHDLLHLCGAANVFGAPGTARFLAVTEADIVAAQPEMVLLPQEVPYAFGEDDAAALRQLDIPAARAGHIYPVDGKLLIWYGTQTARALGELSFLVGSVRTAESRDAD